MCGPNEQFFKENCTCGCLLDGDLCQATLGPNWTLDESACASGYMGRGVTRPKNDHKDCTLAEASNLERVANILKNEAGLQSDVGVESEPIVTRFVICTRGPHHRILLPQPLLLHNKQQLGMRMKIVVRY